MAKFGYDPVAVAKNYALTPHGSLPCGFNWWEICDLEDGYTVAHVAARRGDLPPDFDRWTLADDDGVTVAHVAANSGNLPSDFDRWDLADNHGWTVGQEAKRAGTLAPGFDDR